MANPLTFRQRAKMHDKEVTAFDKMAKLQMQAANDAFAPLNNQSTIAEWAAVVALFEKAHAYDRESASHATQRDAYNAEADAAGEAP